MSTLTQFGGGSPIGTIISGIVNDSRYLSCDGVSTVNTNSSNAFLGEVYPSSSTSSFSRLLPAGSSGAYNWSEVAFGNGIYVAVGGMAPNSTGPYFVTSDVNFVWTSTDGFNWTARQLGSVQVAYSRVIFTGTMFYTVGLNTAVSQGVIFWSTDGITWTQLQGSSGLSARPSEIAFSGSRALFGYVSGSQAILAQFVGTGSFSGTTVTLPSTVNALTFYQGAWVMAGGSTIYYSFDASTWLTWTNLATTINGLAVIGNTLVASVASANATATTTTLGGTFTTRTVPALGMVCSNGTRLLAVPNGSVGAVYTSTDGATWATVATSGTRMLFSGTTRVRPVGTTGFVICSGYASGNFIADNGAFYTVDGTSFSGLPGPLDSGTTEIKSIDYSSTLGLFVAVGKTNATTPFVPVIMTSPDGTIWTRRWSQVTPWATAYGTISSVKWNGSMFVAVTDFSTPTAFTSTDGITWISRTLPSAPGFSVYTEFGNSVWLIASSASTTQVLASTDGITWAARTTGVTLTGTIRGLSWNGSQFCMVSTDGSVYTSPTGNASSFTQQTTQAVGFTNLTVRGSLFIGATNSSDTVLTSATASGVWTSRALNTAQGATSYVVVNSASTVFAIPTSSTSFTNYATSTDGITWTSRTFTQQTFHRFGTVNAGASNGTVFAFVGQGGSGAVTGAMVATSTTAWAWRLFDKTVATAFGFGSTVVSAARNATKTIMAQQASGNQYVYALANGGNAIEAQTVAMHAGNGTHSINTVGFANSTFYAFGLCGSLFSVNTSTDGDNWVQSSTVTIPVALQSSSRVTTSFVANNTGTNLLVTTDTALLFVSTNSGSSWSRVSLPAAMQVSSVNSARFSAAWCTAAGLFLIIPSGLASRSGYYTSPDGVTWTFRSFNYVGTIPNTMLAASPSEFVILIDQGGGGNNNFLVYRSVDGISWEAYRLHAAPAALNSFIWNNDCFAFSSNTGVFISKNGKNWSRSVIGTASTGVGIVSFGASTVAVMTQSTWSVQAYDATKIVAPQIANSSLAIG